MTHTEPQKNIISKTLSAVLLLALLFPSLAPYSVIAQTVPTLENYFGIDAPDLGVIDVNIMQNLDTTTTVGIDEQSKAKIIEMKVIEPVEKNLVKNKLEQKTDSPSTLAENAINYLISRQNADGSWGVNTRTQFITTVAVLEAFQANNVTGAEFDKGIAWISTYFADNNDYMAQKLNVLIPAGEPASVAEILVYDQDTSLGGFPFNNDYKVDPLTTARVIQALSAADYKDPGAEPNYTQSLALKYLLNTKRLDNGWSVFEGGVSNIPVSSEVIEALLLWRHRTLGAIKIDDTLNPAVSSLVGTQNVNGTWGNDLLNTALAYHAIKAAGENPTHELKTLEFFENEQEGNGSFNNDIYQTAKVIKALSISIESGQLVINDIVSETTLQTGAVAEFNLLVSNSGNTAVDSGKIHIMADDFLLESFDLADEGVVVNANSTLNIKIGITTTRNLQGDMAFKVFIQGADGVVYPNSLHKKILTFSADPTGRPALPMFYVAYKSVSSSGTPAITWRWPAKADPNLNKYVIMLRKLGDTTWSSANVSYPQTSFTGVSLVPDQIYEATIGVSSFVDTNITFFTPPVQVKVSASPSAYIAGTVSGKVRAIEGIVYAVNVLGVATATNTISAPPTQDNGDTAGGTFKGITYNENGEFTQNNVPWGSGYVRVSNLLYENYIHKYTNANTNLTNVDVFTNLRPAASETPHTVSRGSSSSSQTPAPTPLTPLFTAPPTQDNGTTAGPVYTPPTQDNGTTTGPIYIPPTQDNGTTAGPIYTPPTQDNGTTAGPVYTPPTQDNGTTAGTISN